MSGVTLRKIDRKHLRAIRKRYKNRAVQYYAAWFLVLLAPLVFLLGAYLLDQKFWPLANEFLMMADSAAAVELFDWRVALVLVVLYLVILYAGIALTWLDAVKNSIVDGVFSPIFVPLFRQSTRVKAKYYPSMLSTFAKRNKSRSKLKKVRVR